MRTFLIICTIGLFSIISFAQQFQLEATIEKDIGAIFDIDGDGVCEYIADTNKVYDGSTHALKYSFPGDLYWHDETTAQNRHSKFPHIDFNGDGKIEVITFIGIAPGNNQILIYDLFNNSILFQINSAVDENIYMNDLIDIDGDNELELVINAYSGTWPNTVYKTYIYSTGVITSASEEKYITLPSKYKLEQNFPNPFNPTTTIRYSLSGPENISIKIYDVSGQLVKEINKEHNKAGEFDVIWDGTNDYSERVSSGAYFYQLSVGNYNEAKKMILLR